MNPVDPGERDLPLHQRPREPREQSEVLLRNRDVQSLSRAFRRMAEVQEALVDHLEQAESARGRGWVAPVVGLGCLVLGLGLGVFGLSEWEKRQEQPPIAVDLGQLQPAQITVEPTPVTVEVPPAPEQAPGVSPELFEKLIGRIEGIDANRAQDRTLIGDLTNRLLESELSNQRLLEQLQVQQDMLASAREVSDEADAEKPEESTHRAVQPSEAAADVSEVGVAAPTEFSADEEDAIWLEALNGLMALGGSPQYRFQQAARVEGQAQLRDVLLVVWAPDGPVNTVIRAEKADFRLQQAAHMLEMHFTGGTRLRDGQKTALPGGGVKIILPEVDTRVWLEHFPALATSSPPDLVEIAATSDAAEEAGVGSGVGPVNDDSSKAEQKPTHSEAELETIRLALDALLSRKLSFGFYRLNRLGGIEAGAMQAVQLAWYEASGRLFKYIEADSMSLHDRGGKWLELRFENGGFRQGDRFTPFREQIYRMHLADQDIAAWRAAGVTVHE